MQTAISTYMVRDVISWFGAVVSHRRISQFGQNEPHQVQHNLMEYVTGQVDDESESAEGEDQSGSAIDSSVEQIMNWSEFDDIIKPRLWIKALIANPQLWDELCTSWSTRLNDAYRNREVSAKRCQGASTF